MSNFIWNASLLLPAKTDLTPLPVGANPNQWVAAADWNQTRQAVLDIQTAARAAPGAQDIRNYGAIDNANALDQSTWTNDVSQAIYNCIAAQPLASLQPALQSTNGIVPGVYIPGGTWVTSLPICTLSAMELYGQGMALSRLWPGLGSPSFNPTTVRGFSGPVIYGAPPYTPSQLPSSSFPSYTAPLVGATGQSLVMSPTGEMGGTGTALILHDSYCWSKFLGQEAYSTALTLRFWVKVTDTPAANLYLSIIGSRGPQNVWEPTYPVDIAIGVYAVCDDGVNVYLRAYLTTGNNPSVWNTSHPFTVPQRGVQHIINSAPITLNTPHNVELNYDGGNVWLYIDGVHQGHVAATGPVVRAPWEGVTIGRAGPEEFAAQGQAPFDVACIHGAIDSVELRNVATHTGTGSFTPPSAKYTGDANTLALYNWDQPSATVQPKNPDGTNNGPLLTLPFVVGQCQLGGNNFNDISPPGFAGLMPHYLRIVGSAFQTAVSIHDLNIYGYFNCSGIIMMSSAETKVSRVLIQQAAQFGLRSSDSVSFFGQCEDIFVDACPGIGIQFFGNVNRSTTISCGIGVQLLAGGALYGCNDQPAWNNYASIMVGPGAAAASQALVRTCSNDAEVWAFQRQLAPLVVRGSTMGACTFQNNLWLSSAGNAPVMYIGVPGTAFDAASGGTSYHLGDLFQTTVAGGTGSIAYNYGSRPGNVVLNNCAVVDNFNTPTSNKTGWLTRVEPKRISNQSSISTTDTLGNNLTGKFTIQHGFTYGDVEFTNAEPDTNYNVVCFPDSYVGSAPAAGSNRFIYPVTKTTGGFRVFVEADPGGTCILTATYHILRGLGNPLLYQPTVVVPSSVTNPLPSTGDFFIGVTIVPGTGNCFAFNQSVGRQTLIEDGTTIAGANYYEMYIEGGGSNINILPASSSGFISVDSYISTSGRLCGILNPGPHNLVFGSQSGNLYFAFGGPRGALPLQLGTFGTQQTPVYIGQRFDTTQPYTSGTLRNLKMDTNVDLVFTTESDSGPQSMAVSSFFGDNWTLGNGSLTSKGGFATQVAQSRYGQTYHYLTAATNLQAIDQAGIPGLRTRFWQPWGSLQTGLQSVVFYIGWEDILRYNSTGAATFAAIQPMLDGQAAAAVWTPPTVQPSSPWVNGGGRAWAAFVPPSSGTSSCVIGGTSIPCTFVTDTHTTAVNQAAAINANGATNTLVTAFAQDIGTGYAVWCQANAQGTAGNGITCTTDGVGGAYWYTGPFGGGVTSFGADTTIIINGITLINNFSTNANTTVNNAIAAIAANGTLNPLVTGTLTSGKMTLTANAVGAAGNSITVSSSGLNIVAPAWANPSTGAAVTTLVNGLNGARTLGIPKILLCNIHPMATWTGVTGAQLTQRGNLNTAIAAYVAGTAGAVTLVDLSTLLADPGTPANLRTAYDAGGGQLNDAAHVAIFNEMVLKIPGTGGTAPSALTYATNPASYAHGVAIAANNATITGTPTRWTVDPPLPTGLSLNAATGQITGTPTTVTALAVYRVVASNAGGATSVNLTITIT